MNFKLHELETITNEFSDDQFVGRGGYGSVYKGVYKGEEIAIKRLHALQGLDDTEFHNEFRNLTKVHHTNIVRLIGYCYETRKNYVQHKGELIFATTMERILCFEYMQGGSLDKHIEDESCDLDWHTCYGIIKGTCEGINHLHSAHEPIFHLDLKPANILLDKNKVAKIADLGLSKLVANTNTYKTETVKGTTGYMPPEYIDSGSVTKKFDVFSLGVIILKILDGNKGHSRLYEIGAEEFTKHVSENWEKKLQTNQMDNMRLKACIEIALRCVVAERNKRPTIKEIVHELEELEAEIKKMSPPRSIETKDLTGQRSSESNFLAVDPTLELRFLFEPRKDISCCVQITNRTDGFIAFNIKTNKIKYNTQPNKGIMPPCSRCYICVTLQAQEKAPPNMQCDDMFLVQSAAVSNDLTSEEVTEEFFKKLIEEKVLDVVTLPIVYVALDRFLHANS